MFYARSDHVAISCARMYYFFPKFSYSKQLLYKLKWSIKSKFVICKLPRSIFFDSRAIKRKNFRNLSKTSIDLKNVAHILSHINERILFFIYSWLFPCFGR